MTMFLPVAKLETADHRLMFTQDTFLLVSSSKMRVSPDGQRWANIYDVDSQKKLFGLDKGSVSVGFQVAKEAGPVFTLDITTE